MFWYRIVIGMTVASAVDTGDGDAVCTGDNTGKCATQSTGWLQRVAKRTKAESEGEAFEDDSAGDGEIVKGGKGRSDEAESKSGKGRSDGESSYSSNYVGGGVGTYSGGPGASWSSEEALTVMAKILYSINNPAQLSKKTDVFDDYECAGGPNFSQKCDYQENEWCKTKVCKLKPEPDTGNLAAKFLRLGFHDCFKYKDGTGGCDGCLEFGPMFGKYVQLHGAANNVDKNRKRAYNDGEDMETGNNGLSVPADVLEKIYTDPTFPPGAEEMSKSLKDLGKSRADLWSFATVVAAEYAMHESNLKCLGTSEIKPQCEPTLYHSDVDFCEMTQSYIPRFYTGRSDCALDTRPSDPLTSSRMPHRKRDYETIKSENQPTPYLNGSMLADFFRSDFGLNVKETVAIMGAHSLGGFQFTHTMMKYRWQFGGDWMLNAVYYRNLMAKPARKQICGGKKHPPTWAGAPGGGLANTGWWIRPLREVPNGGPFLWFHYYHRCPTCYKDDSGDWHSTEERGESSFQTDECCKCHEQDASEVNEECFVKVVHDETAISVDVGLYYSFEVGPQGQPLGCPGLRPEEWSVERLADKSLDALPPAGGGINTWDTEPHCPKNSVKDAGDSMSMSDYVELYADNQDVWATDFYSTLEKVLHNGYDVSDLEVGPDVFGMGRTTCEKRNHRELYCRVN